MSITQSALIESMKELLKLEGLSQEELYNVIRENGILTDFMKSKLFEYMSYEQKHPLLNKSFLELCQCVFQRILNFSKDIQGEIYREINVEMFGGVDQCFMGQFDRLVSCLIGFDHLFENAIQISEYEQMNNIALAIQKDLEMW